MSNMPRKQKAEGNKYEGKAYLDYDEATDYLGIRRTTLYNYVIDLDIKTHKFRRDRRRYLAIADVKRIEQVMENPWLAEEKKESEEAA